MIFQRLSRSKNQIVTTFSKLPSLVVVKPNLQIIILFSSIILYPLYAEQFWAVPPSMTDAIVFTFAIAGIGFTSSINPFDRHIHQRRASKHLANPQIKSHGEGELAGSFLNSSMIRSFELMLTVLSFVLPFWGTFSLGSAQM